QEGGSLKAALEEDVKGHAVQSKRGAVTDLIPHAYIELNREEEIKERTFVRRLVHDLYYRV
ncbi:glutamine synthetase, partial [Pseudomonas aeruginosa]